MMPGGCLCGAVRFAAEGPPITVRQCWCRDCQTLAAGSASINVFFPTDAVTIEGDLTWFDKPADSGTPLARGFCPVCGTHLAVQSHARRHLIGLRAGTFDDTAPLAPRSAIWSASAPRWATLDPAIPHVERQPPPLG